MDIYMHRQCSDTLVVHTCNLAYLCCMRRRERRRPWHGSRPGSERWMQRGSAWPRCSGDSGNRSSSVPLRRWSAARSWRRNASEYSWSLPNLRHLPLMPHSFLAYRPPRLSLPAQHIPKEICPAVSTTNTIALLKTLAHPMSTGHSSPAPCSAQGTTVS